MSWISDFAGRAEEFLNKIDNNAAAILKKEKVSIKGQDVILDEVTSEPTYIEPREFKPRFSPPVVKPNPMKMTRASHSSPSMTAKNEEEQLIDFLNNSAAVDIDQIEMAAPKEPLMNGHAEKAIIEMPEEMKELINENQMLKNEVRSLNSELTLLLSRTKNAEREVGTSSERLSSMDKDVSRLQKEINILNDKLTTSEAHGHKLCIENQRLSDLTKNNEEKQGTTMAAVSNAEKMLSDYKNEVQRRENTQKTELLAMQTRMESIEREFLRVQQESAQETKELNSRLTEARSELEQYRIRAQRTLSEKDKLIAELRKVGSEQEHEDIVSLELEQLRNEKSALFEESEELRCKLDAARVQVDGAEKQLEKLKEENCSALKETEVKLSEEAARRKAAEEHCNAHTEELHAVREELSRQVSHLNLKIRERETELNRLRLQLTRQRTVSPPPVAQVEERITALTTALVRKQAALEQTAKERNLIRLELDQTKNKFRDYVTQVQGRAISVNDTDDAKLQVPSFLLESPFDTGVTRRVKRAYSSLDAVSIRTGVFLRRYPLARIFALCYILFLHLWVCLVLFSRTPETRL